MIMLYDRLSPVILRKKWLWLAALLPLLFISDIFYGGLVHYRIELPVTPGVVLRGMVLVVAIYMFLNHRRLVGERLFVWISLITLTIIPSVLISLFRGQALFFDLAMLSKVLYLPFVTALFVVLIQRYYLSSDEILRFIEYSAYVLGISLLVSQQLGLEKQTYGDYAFGSTGIFYAQNDMTLAFGLALFAAGYRLVMKDFTWLRLGLIAMSAFACVQIGTRGSLAAAAGTAITSVVCVMWNRNSIGPRRRARISKKSFFSLFLLASMAGVLFYGLAKQQEHSYQQDKLNEIAQGDFPRLVLVTAGAKHVLARNSVYSLIGEGSDSFQTGVGRYFSASAARKMVEVDWMDIFGAYGLGFTLVIHAFVTVMIFGAARRFYVTRRALYGLLASAFLFYLGTASFSGHALTSPIPSTIMASYLALYLVSVRKLCNKGSHVWGIGGK